MPPNLKVGGTSRKCKPSFQNCSTLSHNRAYRGNCGNLSDVLLIALDAGRSARSPSAEPQTVVVLEWVFPRPWGDWLQHTHIYDYKYTHTQYTIKMKYRNSEITLCGLLPLGSSLAFINSSKSSSSSLILKHQNIIITTFNPMTLNYHHLYS